ncbi:universal stress protein [Rhizohabitans arisaemae]|uniref:universal stress protein n=1 Tax=Rhizohabitans arisaemae TaxID=2720610 RepID=UPI0024B1CE80|nr:universal stress protein [Rhizohabitans arisaemae]
MVEPRRVVVGYDGSDFSMQALEWAMDEAELRELPLTVAHAWHWPYGTADEETKAHLRKAADHVLYHGGECARSCSTITKVTTDLYEGAAGDRLVELSDRAELIVVGSRGMGALARTVLGSVAGYTAAHASRPVVVVRGPGPIPIPRHRGSVVIGMTGHTPDAAVEFAFVEAALRQLPLEAMHAGYPPSPSWGAPVPPIPDTQALAEAAEETVRERLRPWCARHPTVSARACYVVASPKDALLHASKEASLLVVGGARGHGKIGSVTRAVLQQSLCPVAVVPAAADETAA